MGGILLFGDGILAGEGPVALQVDPGVLQQGLVADHLPLGLGQLRLIGPGIDFRQEGSLLDNLALLVIDLHQLAVHPALHGDGMDRGDGAEPGEIDADVPLFGRGRGHGHARLIEGRPWLGGGLGCPALG